MSLDDLVDLFLLEAQESGDLVWWDPAAVAVEDVVLEGGLLSPLGDGCCARCARFRLSLWPPAGPRAQRGSFATGLQSSGSGSRPSSRTNLTSESYFHWLIGVWSLQASW